MAYLPALLSYINTGIVQKVEREKMYFAAQPNTVTGWRMYYQDETPENSIAIIPIVGAITADAAMYIERDIIAASNNANVMGIVFATNTPGGAVSSAVSISGAIEMLQKPTATFVKSACFSAGMWIGASTQRIFLANELTEVGSIGVMVKYMDMDNFLKEKLGISIFELYATKSTNKNEEIRELMKGNELPIIQNLDFINEKFHAIMKSKLNVKDEEALTGRTFYAPDAIQKKLAHQIAPLATAIQWVYQKAEEQNLSNTFNKYFN